MYIFSFCHFLMIILFYVNVIIIIVIIVIINRCVSAFGIATGYGMDNGEVRVRVPVG
jgi:hypothetical protein